ncbi:hypothetical protein LTR08_005781 [Meristemomyces frigidus]|nr:hypothetical protein LTR08_005781 [Meristemomyces frigidus]
MLDSAFLNLPTELRLRIYEDALQFQGVLQRPLKASSWRNSRQTPFPANASLLLTSRQVHEEAKDVFYKLNAFKVSYHHMCACEIQPPFPAFDELRIRELEITNFLPRLEERETCQFCAQSGFGLIAFLQKLPKLRSVKIAFEDLFSFTEFAPENLRRLHEHNQALELSCTEVGHVGIEGLHLKLQLQSPALHRAWRHLASQERDSGICQDRRPGQKIMQRALGYLQFEANSYHRTAAILASFFVPSEDDDTPTLRFTGLIDEGRRRAEFTVALAVVLNDTFAEDGGSASVNWVDLEGIYGERWQFAGKASISSASIL